ncbi:MAG: hypothetical protein ACR2QF_13380 [Geminicoccaceae bacterium]
MIGNNNFGVKRIPIDQAFCQRELAIERMWRSTLSTARNFPDAKETSINKKTLSSIDPDPDPDPDHDLLTIVF